MFFDLLDLIVKNGTVFNAHGAGRYDIGVLDGKIVTLGNASLWGEAREIIDASGLYVMPGMLDSHAHIASPGDFPSLDDYHSGTIAAAYGGTTTIVDFAFICGGETPRSALERKLAEANGQCVIDYAFHPCINRADEQSFREIEELMDEGFSSVKLFTVYRDSLMLEAAGVYRVLRLVAQKGCLAMVHAENAEMIEYNIRRDIAAGHTSTKDHPASRPVISELTALADVIEMAHDTGASVLFAHISTGKVKRLLTGTRRDRVHIYAETCPHYLTLSDSVYAREDGCKYVCNPPIRSEASRDSLWELVQNGLISVVNSDHTDFSYAQKLQNRDYYPGIPGGLPALETRGMALFSEGVAKGRIGMERFVELTSANVAKLMGLYPQKGVIGIGSDADIVVIDPDAQRVNHVSDMHMKTDYSPYEGMKMTGAVRHTLVRGNSIIRDGHFTGTHFRGGLQKRGRPVFQSI